MRCANNNEIAVSPCILLADMLLCVLGSWIPHMHSAVSFHIKSLACCVFFFPPHPRSYLNKASTTITKRKQQINIHKKYFHYFPCKSIFFKFVLPYTHTHTQWCHFFLVEWCELKYLAIVIIWSNPRRSRAIWCQLITVKWWARMEKLQNDKYKMRETLWMRVWFKRYKYVMISRDIPSIHIYT